MYIKLNGKWIYLYRAVDSQGNAIDFLLRARRDKVAAKAFFKKAFFKKAIKNNGRPEKTAIDKRVKPMLGFKNFYSAKKTITGIEMVHMIKKGQIHGFDAEINLSKFCDHDGVIRLKFRKKKPVNLDIA